MRKLISRLLRSNRGDGPKPSGLCLWQDVKQLDQIVQELVTKAADAPEENWESLQQKLHGQAVHGR